MVLAVLRTVNVKVNGETREIPYSGAGFFGMCPVFETMEEAKKWANGKFEIVTLMGSNLP